MIGGESNIQFLIRHKLNGRGSSVELLIIALDTSFLHIFRLYSLCTGTIFKKSIAMQIHVCYVEKEVDVTHTSSSLPENGCFLSSLGMGAEDSRISRLYRA